MTDRPVRVRYAPSPTGMPHVGNLRTALFDWLWARHSGGTFILRIEDTDRDRYVDGAVDKIMETLDWLGLTWDEGPRVGGPHGPYVQSERLALYQAAVNRLLAAGHAYRCFCTPATLREMREAQQSRHEAPGYDRRCRELNAAEQERRASGGEPAVVRLAVPLTGETTFDDFVRGPITVNNRELDDLVLLKSDGFPTYNLASVVDDLDMEISHVIRGEEFIASTPKHVLIYQALAPEAPLPAFVHMPVTLGPDKAKLSKRHGALPVLAYREAGYLPEAIINFLALLGWSLDDKTELLSRGELIAAFDLTRIGATSAVFDRDKLSWMNGVYIRGLSAEELADRLMPYLTARIDAERDVHFTVAYARGLVPLVHERLKTLAEGYDLLSFFFCDEVPVDRGLLLRRGAAPAAAALGLRAAERALEGLQAWSAAALEACCRDLATELGSKAGDLFWLIRVAATGRDAAPPLFITLEHLGRARTQLRLARAADATGAEAGSPTAAHGGGAAG